MKSFLGVLLSALFLLAGIVNSLASGLILGLLLVFGRWNSS